MTKIFQWPVALLLTVTLHSQLTSAFAQGTAFTYQGQLQNNGNLASGTYAMTFALFNTNTTGVAIAGPVTNNSISVTNGLFTITVDFGSAFTEATNWLEIAIRTNGGNFFSTLTPRQQLTPVPYAAYAAKSGNLSGTLPVGQLSGQVDNGQLVNSSISIYAGAGLGGGGSSPLGGSITLSNAGVLSVSGNDDITVSNSSGVIMLGDTATSDGTPGTLVKRDTTGSFSVTNLTLNGTLNLPFPCDINSGTNAVMVDMGSLYLGAHNFLGSGSDRFHNTGVGDFTLYVEAYNGSQEKGSGYNTAVGETALHDCEDGWKNVGVGFATLYWDTHGSYNSGFGFYSLFYNSSGNYNSAYGFNSLFYNMEGNYNTAVGASALYNNTNGVSNTAIGNNTLSQNTIGNTNTAVGESALAGNTVGNDNIAIGELALINNAGGNDNTAVGGYALLSNANGSNNIALGYQAGYNITKGSHNIDIDNTGFASDSRDIRIGTEGQQTNAFVAGIYGTPLPSTNILLVYADEYGQLGTSGPLSPVLIPNSNLTGNGTCTVLAGNGLSGGGAVSLGGSITLSNAGVLSVTGNGDITVSNFSGAITLGDTATSSGTPGTLVKLDASGNFSAGTITANLAGNAATATTASNLTGNVADFQLSTNVALLNTGQTFSGNLGISKTTPDTNGTAKLSLAAYGGRQWTWQSVSGYGGGTPGAPGGSVQLVDSSTNFAAITIIPGNNVGIGNTSPSNLLVVGGSSSPAYCNGTTWVNGSDRDSKQGFHTINAREVLARVSALPITEWKYKAEANGTEHLGPMAQDFHAAFGLNGTDDKHIATVDEEGVALAAIQGLDQKLNEKDAEIQTLKQQNDSLAERLNTLEVAMKQFAERK